MAAITDTASAIPAPTASARRLAAWLFVCAFMVFAMAVIGAITRLTESGLSMVVWEPLIGAIPPLSQSEWDRVFDLYKQTPEYVLENAGMSLAAFKEIYFWEWFHRLWGRLIGLVFALPLLWFWLRGDIARAAPGGTLKWKLLGLLALGGLQGALGWYMVMSGLVDRPSVSQYRLAAHLSVAILIYLLLIWVGLGLLRPKEGGAAISRSLRLHGWAALAMVGLTAFWGALVAGLDAGMAYNTFPLMEGHVLPPEAWSLNPPSINFFENTAMVQFTHRWLAQTTALFLLLLWVRARIEGLSGRAAAAAAAVAIMVLVQVSLGVGTLLMRVPIPLAAAHQAGALLLLTAVLWFLHETRRA